MAAMASTTFYKITLNDWNCSPIADGLAEFFTEDIERFEKLWLASGNIPEELARKFARSKNGECVTDWYSDDPEYNIVQKGRADIYAEKECRLRDIRCASWNAYGWPSRYAIQDWHVRFLWIGFQERHLRLAEWTARNVMRYNEFCDMWEQAWCDGNPVLALSGDTLETICHLRCGRFEDEAELREDVRTFALTEELQGMLLRDIPGEAG